MNNTKQKTSSMTITFYVLAVLLVFVFAFMSWYIFDSIKEAMTQYNMTFGEFWGEMWESIINMFVTQSLPFLVYAFICYGIGYVINELVRMRQPEVCSSVVVAQESDQKEITEVEDLTEQQPLEEAVEADDNTLEKAEEVAESQSHAEKADDQEVESAPTADATKDDQSEEVSKPEQDNEAA